MLARHTANPLHGVPSGASSVRGGQAVRCVHATLAAAVETAVASSTLAKARILSAPDGIQPCMRRKQEGGDTGSEDRVSLKAPHRICEKAPPRTRPAGPVFIFFFFWIWAQTRYEAARARRSSEESFQARGASRPLRAAPPPHLVPCHGPARLFSSCSLFHHWPRHPAARPHTPARSNCLPAATCCHPHPTLPQQEHHSTRRRKTPANSSVAWSSRSRPTQLYAMQWETRVSAR